MKNKIVNIYVHYLEIFIYILQWKYRIYINIVLKNKLPNRFGLVLFVTNKNKTIRSQIIWA